MNVPDRVQCECCWVPCRCLPTEDDLRRRAAEVRPLLSDAPPSRPARRSWWRRVLGRKDGGC
jgi:hypothetical protein